MAEDRMLSDEILLGIINSKSGGGGGGGTGNYNDLSNKPQIGGVTLSGNKSASDLGLASEDDLANKQDALTAGDYVSIDARNNISVNRELTPHQTSYRIKGTGRDTMNITKYIDGVQESSTDYGYSQGTTRTIDDAFTINDTYSSAGYIWQFVWLKDSTTHDKDYTVEYRSYEGAFDFTEVFNDEDLSGYKLVIKSEMDTALTSKQNATDNSLQTTDKTVVGAINEHEGDISSLKSGLTNVDVALSVPDGTGKNLIPMTVEKIKALNTSGTWSGNTYTKNSVSYELQTDTSQNIIGIVVNGTATGGEAILSLYLGTNIFNNMILSGCPQVQDYNSYYLAAQLNESPWTTEKDIGWGKDITIQNGKDILVYICVKAGITANNLTFYPMIRPATITDSTFAPYIPSVEARLESVEKPSNINAILIAGTSVNAPFLGVILPKDVKTATITRVIPLGLSGIGVNLPLEVTNYDYESRGVINGSASAVGSDTLLNIAREYCTQVNISLTY